MLKVLELYISSILSIIYYMYHISYVLLYSIIKYRIYDIYTLQNSIYHIVYTFHCIYNTIEYTQYIICSIYIPYGIFTFTSSLEDQAYMALSPELLSKLQIQFYKVISPKVRRGHISLAPSISYIFTYYKIVGFPQKTF